jgi:hypothetical protein
MRGFPCFLGTDYRDKSKETWGNAAELMDFIGGRTGGENGLQGKRGTSGIVRFGNDARSVDGGSTLRARPSGELAIPQLARALVV